MWAPVFTAGQVRFLLMLLLLKAEVLSILIIIQGVCLELEAYTWICLQLLIRYS